ncbi:MAG: hypothetical protein P4L45_13655 [Ignavibacteriaceae bacterium]|nr:hypothetical protein [Ignavibacteriaceae bacterium]
MNELKLKTGKEVVLDLNNYTFKEYTFNNMIIILGTILIDSKNETYIVDRILIDTIILKDSNSDIFSFPKEDMYDFRQVDIRR